MDILHAQEAFVQLLGHLKPEDKSVFLQWVSEEYSPSIVGSKGALESVEEEGEDDLLDSIAADLRGTIPLNCLAPDEPTYFPVRGQNSDMSPLSTLHVDSFLYPTDEDVDSLCDQLGIGRYLCKECGSWNTKPLDFVSHSISREQLKYVFCCLLTGLTGKVVLDVGSRLGTVLWGGYIYSQAARLIGVEKNSYFCELQCQVIKKYSLGERVHVLCTDVCSVPHLLQEVDIVILNNVFEFFCSPEAQVKIWSFLYLHLRRKGTLLVTIPSIHESINTLQFEVPLDVGGWVTEATPTAICTRDEGLENIHLYCVLCAARIYSSGLRQWTWQLMLLIHSNYDH